MNKVDNIAVSVKHVSKDFTLPHEKVDSVKGLFLKLFRTSRGFELQHALKNIDFDVKKGEFFGIVGRNGSGKSTLLKIIAQIYQPTKGSVTVNGRLVPFIELGVGFNPELTGRENVYLNGALMGFSQTEVADKYQAIVDFAEIERFMDQKLKNYSSGMQVRLAFSVATILAESDVLLIDEVLAVGDADFQRKCFEYFKGLKKNKKTVIFVSHDMGAVREFCDRAILIDKSEIIATGSANQIAKEYTKLFLPDEYEQQKRDKQYRKILKERALNNGKWGSGGLDIADLKISKASYKPSDKTVEVSYTIDPAGYKGEIIPGITVKNEKGQPVYGTNSDLVFNHEKKIILSDKSVKTVWELPNIFNEGIYFIEPAIISDTSETLQWWDDAASFRIVNPTSTPYQVAPEINLTIK